MLQLLAEDCIFATTRLLTGDRAPIYACEGLTRSVIEASGRLGWLAEPWIRTKQRVARWQTERLYSAAELSRVQLPAEAGMDPAATKRSIFETAEVLGFNKMPSQRGRPAELEEKRPSATYLVTQSLESVENLGPLTMNYLSGVVHGTLYALLQSIDASLAEGDEGAAGGMIAPVMLRASSFRTLLILQTLAYAGGMKSVMTLFGWEDEDWSRLGTDLRRLVREAVAANAAAPD
jgi:hypothetical protein